MMTGSAMLIIFRPLARFVIRELEVGGNSLAPEAETYETDVSL